MKKFCLVVLALTLVSGAFAQDKWVGGSTSIVATDGSSSFDFVPEFGIFLTDAVSLEAGLGFGVASHHKAFSANVVGRYWLPLTNKLSYTPGVGLGFGHDNIAGLKVNSFDLNLYLGALNYQLNNKWAAGVNFCSLRLHNIFDHLTPAFALSSSTTVTVKYCF